MEYVELKQIPIFCNPFFWTSYLYTFTVHLNKKHKHLIIICSFVHYLQFKNKSYRQSLHTLFLYVLKFKTLLFEALFCRCCHKSVYSSLPDSESELLAELDEPELELESELLLEPLPLVLLLSLNLDGLGSLPTTSTTE